MGARELDGIDDFLGHSATVSGGAFLKNWKKDDQIDIVLHPTAKILVLWSHRWFRIVNEKKDGKETGKTTIWSMRFNSMEKEAILKRQHFRNDDGSREYPPEVCPFSLLLEWVREMIDADKISWTDPIFVIKSDREDIEILAGGFCGLFQSRDLSEEQLEELKDAKVKVSEAFKQDARPGMNYVFSVVQYEAPDEGCVIAMEGKAIGQKMQKAIIEEKKKWRSTATPDRGDPMKMPYVFRWEYDEKQTFDEKYNVITMPTEALPITEEIQAVLDDPPPKLDILSAPSNVALLRTSFEEHWVHDVVPPWDELFEAAMNELKGTAAAELPTDFKPENYEKSKKQEKPAKKEAASEKKTEPSKTAPAPVEDDGICCDVCKAPMREDEFTCKKCGAEYDPETGMRLEKKPEPAKQTRTRSQAAAEKKAATESKSTDEEVASPRRRREN